MRCFIAIDLPEEIRKEIFLFSKQLLQEDSNLKIKPVEEENLHLTLRFLGELSDDEINKIKGALSKIKFKPFEASLNSLGIFPSEHFIRVVWIALEPSEKFKEIHNQIDSELEKMGIKKDGRFEAHVTIARIKFIKDKKSFVDKIKTSKVKPLNFQVDSFSLKKSTLMPGGPIYEDIVNFKF